MTQILFWKKKILLLWLLLLPVFATSCGRQEVTSVKESSPDETTGNEALQETSRKTILVDIGFEGGSGKAYIKSPVEVTDEGGSLSARFVWSSANYDYMIVDGIRYDNENEGGESTFTVPVESISGTLKVIGDTVAMSTPHEIEYLITWGEKSEVSDDIPTENLSSAEEVREALKNAGLTKTGSTELKYATGFEVEKYGDYSYVSIKNSGNYLIVPKGLDVPEYLPQDTVVLKKPMDKTYLVSTSAMDLVKTLGALDMIKLSGTKAEDWYIDEARSAMENGDIIYAGKYRAPDYELILESRCNLAIENTMIYHEPTVKEKLTELGIPVLVETSSTETHPLGRLEWIKLYGLLYDREKEADEYFETQLEKMERVIGRRQNTGKTVAFFHVTGNGLINVRKSGDYITRMIELAGGNYVLTGAGEGQSAISTMNMQMEEFYAEAVGADIIIYNSTIGGGISSIDELVKKNGLFGDFKAVKEGNVYCTEQDLFQQITGMAEFMQDLNDVFCGIDRDYTYLNRLD